MLALAGLGAFLYHVFCHNLSPTIFFNKLTTVLR